MLKKAALAIGAVAMLAIVPSLVKTQEVQKTWLAREITPDGPAMFFRVENDRRTELWSVDCRQRMRGCRARAPGLVVRLDDTGRPWLIAAITPTTRISIQRRNHTWNVPALINRPLDADTLHRMSSSNSFLVFEENGRVVQRIRTTGMDEVVAYLQWVSGESARTLGDARLWPRDQPLSAKNMTPSTLERYEIMQRRRLESARQLVPETKPQIEFALRAQDGLSF